MFAFTLLSLKPHPKSLAGRRGTSAPFSPVEARPDDLSDEGWEA